MHELIQCNLYSPHGQKIVSDATNYLRSLVKRNRFNSERAREVYPPA